MTEPEPAAVTDGYLTLLPFFARAEHEITAMIGGVAPWGSPLVSGLSGTVSSGLPWIGIISESPTAYIRPTSPLEVKELEFIHLQRLAVDARTATGTELYDAILGEAEPPDFTVASQGQQLGVEMTQFAIRERRQAQGLFFEISKRVSNQQRHRISHLAGYQVYMWFGSSDDAAGLPFRTPDQDLYDALLEALIKHVPEPAAHRMQDGQLPQNREFRPVRSVSDAQFFSIPLLGGVPASPFYAITGLQLVLAFQSDHLIHDEWERLRKAVSRKDRECNNVLVISVGAPDRMGRCFASEEALADAMLRYPEEVKANHLSSIILHFWSSGRAVQLLGEKPVELWPEIFQGFSPAFHPYRTNPSG